MRAIYLEISWSLIIIRSGKKSGILPERTQKSVLPRPSPRLTQLHDTLQFTYSFPTLLFQKFDMYGNMDPTIGCFFRNVLFNVFFTFVWWTTKEECCVLICLTCPTNCAVAGDESEPGRWFLSLPQLTEETLAVGRTVAQVHNDVSRWSYRTFLINRAESKGSIWINSLNKKLWNC